MNIRADIIASVQCAYTAPWFAAYYSRPVYLASHFGE